ncbi:MAG: LLM class flavin-dependent oxidoreductase [Acidimicrobiia bacterium]
MRAEPDTLHPFVPLPAPPRPPLSVLELAPVVEGSTPAAALSQSVELARLAERLGYRRMWVAEHHNMPGIASSSPPVLIAHLAASTEHLTLGAGGVMLPNHAALAVAEQFGMLEALHPGRIDLGLGRAPGTDPFTAAALRRAARPGADDFPEQLRDLLAFFDGTHPRITAVPAEGYRPALWLLGSSDYSAQVAGLLGLPFSFAHHFASGGTAAALDAYRSSFRPSETLSEPYVMLGVPVICADTSSHARYIAGPSALSIVRLRTGRPSRLPTPEEAAEHVYSPHEKAIVAGWQAPLICGDPAEVRAGLEELVTRTGADELMVASMIHGREDRLRSYELVAKAWGMP